MQPYPQARQHANIARRNKPQLILLRKSLASSNQQSDPRNSTAFTLVLLVCRRSRTVCLCNARHFGIGMLLLKILLVALGCRFDSSIAWVPVGGADLVVLS
jgi:hypothetical protein